MKIHVPVHLLPGLEIETVPPPDVELSEPVAEFLRAFANVFNGLPVDDRHEVWTWWLKRREVHAECIEHRGHEPRPIPLIVLAELPDDMAGIVQRQGTVIGFDAPTVAELEPRFYPGLIGHELAHVRQLAWVIDDLGIGLFETPAFSERDEQRVAETLERWGLLEVETEMRACWAAE